MKISEYLSEKLDIHSMDNLILDIEKNKVWLKLTDEIIETLYDEGWMEELDDENTSHYDYFMLPIPEKDKNGLIKFDNETVERYNIFDMALKEKFGTKKYLDLIDYDNGIIRIVRHK